MPIRLLFAILGGIATALTVAIVVDKVVSRESIRENTKDTEPYKNVPDAVVDKFDNAKTTSEEELKRFMEGYKETPKAKVNVTQKSSTEVVVAVYGMDNKCYGEVTHRGESVADDVHIGDWIEIYE